MNEKQLHDLLDFLQHVIDKFDTRYTYMRDEVMVAVKQIAHNQTKFQEELIKLMNDNEKAIIAAFDKATSAVGDRIAKLIAAGNSGASPEFLAALQKEVDTLTGLGSDGTVPVEPPAGV